MSTTRSFSTNMCPNGVMMAGLLMSVSMGLMQASECSPSQFMAQEPQMPSRQDRLSDRVESWVSFIFNKASKYMGAQSLRSM